MLLCRTTEKISNLVSFPVTLLKHGGKTTSRRIHLAHASSCSPSWKRKHSSRNVRDLISLHHSPGQRETEYAFQGLTSIILFIQSRILSPVSGATTGSSAPHIINVIRIISHRWSQRPISQGCRLCPLTTTHQP